MPTIAFPEKINFKKGQNKNEGEVIIEPLFPGYGITLGNSLRRVLLSSLPGAAPIGVKIKGVDHEFTTLPHLKEDILEFILNLKQLRLKVFTDEVVKLKLDVHGKKEIKASLIEKNSDVEIVNPDLVLGHITDMSGSLTAEIFVSRGMGYEPIEARENKSKEIGYIEMDAIFSPILKVGVRVENVRVGKMTNWDKLILSIITDGTITPEDAFHQAVKILIEQFTALLDKEKAAMVSSWLSGEEAGASADEKKAEAEEEPKKKRGRGKKEK
jgi:DNA-directed RNA polymerase subunit alpha